MCHKACDIIYVDHVPWPKNPTPFCYRAIPTQTRLRSRGRARLPPGSLANQRNVTIISSRRLGKTALIRHFLANQRKFIPVFVDLYRMIDQEGIVLRIVQESLQQVGKPTSALLKGVAQAKRSLGIQHQLRSAHRASGTRCFGPPRREAGHGAGRAFPLLGAPSKVGDDCAR